MAVRTDQLFRYLISTYCHIVKVYITGRNKDRY